MLVYYSMQFTETGPLLGQARASLTLVTETAVQGQGGLGLYWDRS